MMKAAAFTAASLTRCQDFAQNDVLHCLLVYEYGFKPGQTAVSCAYYIAAQCLAAHGFAQQAKNAMQAAVNVSMPVHLDRQCKPLLVSEPQQWRPIDAIYNC